LSLLFIKYFLDDHIKKNETGGACMYHEWRGGGRADRVLVKKPARKRPLGSSRRRRDDNIEMDLQEMVWGHELD
jgi:hypothetical protein